MITLPYPPRRSQLTVFAATMGTALGGAASVLLSVLGGIHLAVALVPLGLAAGLLGSRWEAPSLLAYRVTGKAARVFSRVAQAWISLLVFAVVTVAGGRTGAPLALAEPSRNGSAWTPIPDRSRLRAAGASVGGGLPAIVLWMRESGQLWAAPLLPLFGLLGALDPGRDADTPPTNTYTLF